MPDERSYYSDAEKAAYRGAPCEVCGTPTAAGGWYPSRSLADMTNAAGRWSKYAYDVCPVDPSHATG